MYNYKDAIEKTNSYIYEFSDYNDYIKLEDMPYNYETGENKINPYFTRSGGGNTNVDCAKGGDGGSGGGGAYARLNVRKIQDNPEMYEWLTESSLNGFSRIVIRNAK